MRALFAAVFLAGCAAQAPSPGFDIPLRNPTAPVASQADVTPARLAGRWVVTEAAGVPPGAEVRISEGRMSIDGRGGAFVASGAGRFVFGGEEVWVHWLDADDRTAALGDPAGRRVWIMDRTGRPGERRLAARDILEWYGYDLSRMEGQ